MPTDAGAGNGPRPRGSLIVAAATVVAAPAVTTRPQEYEKEVIAKLRTHPRFCLTAEAGDPRAARLAFRPSVEHPLVLIHQEVLRSVAEPLRHNDARTRDRRMPSHDFGGRASGVTLLQLCPRRVHEPRAGGTACSATTSVITLTVLTLMAAGSKILSSSSQHSRVRYAPEITMHHRGCSNARCACRVPVLGAT